MTRPLRSMVSDALGERLRQLDSLREADRPETELIHEIRVAAKQFRACLKLLHKSTSPAVRGRQDHLLASAARSLAADRDLLVIRETLERLARKCDRFSGRDSLHRMLLHLREQRLHRTVQPATLRTAGATVTNAGSAIRRRLRRGLSNGALLEALRREYRKARRLTRKFRRKPGRDSWHRWRKQIKALHYQASSLVELRPGKLRRLAVRCWRLQAQLGRHHDLHITRERLTRMRIDPVNEPCRTRSLRITEREIERLELKVRRATRSFLGLKSREFIARLERNGEK